MDPLYGQRSSHVTQKETSGKWIIIDAKGKVLGRLATKVAMILQGKDQPEYTPGAYVGSRVLIINAAEVKTTGSKMEDKEYRWHTGFFGGLKSRTMKEQSQKAPEKVLLTAIKGMLPKTRYGRALLTRVRVVMDANHGMEAQKPVVQEI